MTPQEAAQRLSEIAPSLRPGRLVKARELAAWLGVDAQRRWHRNRPDPGIDGDPGDLMAFAAEAVALDTLMAFAACNEERADLVATTLAAALADGCAIGELVAARLAMLGIDADEVNALDDVIRAPVDLGYMSLGADLQQAMEAAIAAGPDWQRDGVSLTVAFAPGRKVRYAHPGNGWDGDQKTAAERLVLGEVYTVGTFDDLGCRSYITLDGVEGRFNTVQFDTADDGEPCPEHGGTEDTSA